MAEQGEPLHLNTSVWFYGHARCQYLSDSAPILGKVTVPAGCRSAAVSPAALGARTAGLIRCHTGKTINAFYGRHGPRPTIRFSLLSHRVS